PGFRARYSGFSIAISAPRRGHARQDALLQSYLSFEPIEFLRSRAWREGRHLRDAIIVDARDKLLVFMRRSDVEPTNYGSEQPCVIFRVMRSGHIRSPRREVTAAAAFS